MNIYIYIEREREVFCLHFMGSESTLLRKSLIIEEGSLPGQLGGPAGTKHSLLQSKTYLCKFNNIY